MASDLDAMKFDFRQKITVPRLNQNAKFRTPYLAQFKSAVISKIIFKSVPGNMVSVWLRILVNSVAA
jgi:hypothetical protein